MPKTENGQSAATWRKRDKSYRDQEKKRRAANARKREAAAQGMTLAELDAYEDEVRAAQAEQQSD